MLLRPYLTGWERPDDNRPVRVADISHAYRASTEIDVNLRHTKTAGDAFGG
jgi:hypothetical protein